MFIECQFMAALLRKTKKLKILQFMTINEDEKLKTETFY
jgi:hypothetical protein